MNPTEANAKTPTGKVNWVINPKTYATILYLLQSLPLELGFIALRVVNVLMQIRSQYHEHPMNSLKSSSGVHP